MRRLNIFIFLLLSSMVFAQQNRTVFDDVRFISEPAKYINTVSSDISPVFINDSIYFTGVSEKYLDKTNRKKKNTDFYNIYSASLDKTGNISSSRKLVPGFGNDFHEGPADYCEATGELFVTVSNVNNFEKIQKAIPVENIRFGLVIKKKINGKWITVEKLPFNDKRYHFAQPAISITGDTLVFSSDLKPNYGYSDLYMSIRKNGVWSSPVNLGNEINTPGNELFPTFIPGNILSFASNGKTPNKGGLDIYYSHFPMLNKVEILNNEINTSADEFGLIIDPSGNFGYYSSNRIVISDDDIFRLDIKKLYKNLTGMVLSSESNLPVAKAKIIFYTCDGNIIGTQQTDSAGNFAYEILENQCLQVEISKQGYESNLFNISGIPTQEFRLKLKQFYEILVLDEESSNPLDNVSISFNDEINLNTNQQGIISLIPPLPENCEFIIQKEGYVITALSPKTIEQLVITRDTVSLFKKKPKTVFFTSNVNSATGELKILQESTSVFDQIIKILQLNSDIKVELGWHTDSRGNDADNRRQSTNRAGFAARYIVNNGIEKDRISGTGYGESQLVNRCKNGIECSEEEHRENRRIELKIMGIIKPQLKNIQEE